MKQKKRQNYKTPWAKQAYLESEGALCVGSLFISPVEVDQIETVVGTGDSGEAPSYFDNF